MFFPFACIMKECEKSDRIKKFHLFFFTNDKIKRQEEAVMAVDKKK